MVESQPPPVCDYEGSDYRTRFWEHGGRDYEDQVERIALRRLMPATGGTLIDVGAGFGRLAQEYGGYNRVILFDYSRTLLREAQAHLGTDPRFVYVAGNWYEMPFQTGVFDTMVQVRTIHHAADVPALMSELGRIAAPGGHYVLEFANKRNLKALLRFALGRQTWSPYAPEPVEFVALNFDFHPRWMNHQLQRAGFRPLRRLAVSHFRLPLLKRALPANLLAAADRLLQPVGRWWTLTPSLFVLSSHPITHERAPTGALFACPTCQTPLSEPQDGRLACPGCGRQWRVEDNLYDFKEAID